MTKLLSYIFVLPKILTNSNLRRIILLVWQILILIFGLKLKWGLYKKKSTSTKLSWNDATSMFQWETMAGSSPKYCCLSQLLLFSFFFAFAFVLFLLFNSFLEFWKKQLYCCLSWLSGHYERKFQQEDPHTKEQSIPLTMFTKQC